MSSPHPRLDLVIGCNGAGKSTLIAKHLQPILHGSVFVNADEIAKKRWPAAAEEHSYDAARIAERTRDTLIATGRPLIAETVFSHPSKLELISTARTAGFDVHVHAVMIPEELARHRVRTRVESGGHNVPEDKIRSRYHRLWPLVATAIEGVESAHVYDNSTDRMRIVAEFIRGVPASPPSWPSWTPAPLRALTELR
ncbi:zeta toxin family protein [Gordonia sp. HY442]|uniref:zeta toxin family protein n=1 Tax=Gordonia zhenghanii TaxID=2911516 RepID=UPI001F00E67B|nr:zeta toxin family protein [Gordonia zhenghanii]MCF8603064.1 zeta toxin family protein [Gordonia zhenghanii]